MIISYSFDDNEVAADEPLGTVTISEGSDQIQARSVWLDAFFSALVTAYNQSSNGVATVEVEGEVECLQIERRGDGLELAYGMQKIWLNSTKEFQGHLKQACADFLASFEDGIEENPLFEPVRAFVT